MKIILNDLCLLISNRGFRGCAAPPVGLKMYPLKNMSIEQYALAVRLVTLVEAMKDPRYDPWNRYMVNNYTKAVKLVREERQEPWYALDNIRTVQDLVDLVNRGVPHTMSLGESRTTRYSLEAFACYISDEACQFLLNIKYMQPYPDTFLFNVGSSEPPYPGADYNVAIARAEKFQRIMTEQCEKEWVANNPVKGKKGKDAKTAAVPAFSFEGLGPSIIAQNKKRGVWK